MPDDLITVDSADSSEVGDGVRSGWVVAGAAVLVAVLIGSTLIDSSPAAVSTTTEAIEPGEFIGEEAAALGEFWIRSLSRGDEPAVLTSLHPDSTGGQLVDLFRLFRGAGQIDVDEVRFGAPTQPQLCYSATAGEEMITGSLIFRPFQGRWLIWEARPNVDNCFLPSVATEPSRPLPMVSPLQIETAIPLRLLAIEPGVTNLAVIDLETAFTTTYSSTAHNIRGFAGAVMAPDRTVLAWSYSTVLAFRGPLNQTDLEIQPTFRDTDEPARLAGLRVIPDHDSRNIWLFQSGIGFGPDPQPAVLELRSMLTGERLRYMEVDGSRFPVAATEAGLVFNRSQYLETADGWITEPGSESTTLVLDSGLDIRVGSGRAIAASRDVIVRLVCPGLEHCDLGRENELVLTTSDGGGFVDRPVAKPIGGTWLPVGDLAIPGESMPLATVSADGSRLLIAVGQDIDDNGTPATSQLVVVDLNSGSSRIVAKFGGRAPLTTWSHDGEWIASIEGSDIRLLTATGDGPVVELPGVIPDGFFLVAAG